MDYVIDASAWLRYVLQDGPICDGMERAILEAQTGANRLHAPQLFAAEVAHVLHRLRLAGRLTSGLSGEHLDYLLALPIQYHAVPALAVIASRLAWEHRLSVYDALYLTVAIGCHARLLTADEDLARAARTEGCA